MVMVIFSDAKNLPYRLDKGGLEEVYSSLWTQEILSGFGGGDGEEEYVFCPTWEMIAATDGYISATENFTRSLDAVGTVVDTLS
jgi:hypothetical protein